MFMAKTQGIDKQCPIEAGLNILSGKWKMEIKNIMVFIKRDSPF